MEAEDALRPRPKKTHCPQGHPLVEGNLRKGRHAGKCLLCHRIRETRSYDDDAKAWIAIIVNDPCCYCGEPGGTIDHIVPRSLGGTHEWSNLTAACFSCNARKRIWPLLRFVRKNAA